MTPPQSFVGRLSTTPAMLRRVVLVLLIVIFAVLALFPQRYRSAVSLAPSDPSTLGLGAALGQLGASNSVFGSVAAVEVTLRVARGVNVRTAVIDRLHLVERLGLKNRVEADRWLQRTVDVNAQRGNMVEIETKQRDPEFAEALIGAFADATRQRLAVINRQQTNYKRGVLEELVSEAGARLSRAQAAYDNFRLRTRYSNPTAAIEAIGERIPALEASIKAKEVELSAARAFATENNMAVRQIQAELTALRQQLAQQRAINPSEQNSVGRVVQQSTAGERLERELNISLALYEGYRRYLQGTAVEDLTSTANLRVIEPPYIDTARQVNLPFLALAIMFAILGVAIEFYQLRPPLEARRAE